MRYKKSDFKIGQKLYYVDAWHSEKNIQEVTIKTIGNKLLHMECGRQIYIEDLKLKTEFSPTQFYTSKEQYFESQQAQKNLFDIQEKVRRLKYLDLTHSQINDLCFAFDKIINNKELNNE